MPAVEQKNRIKIRKLGPIACENVGDICFIFYDHYWNMWKIEPRWRTNHRIYKDFVKQPEACDYFNFIYDQLKDKYELDDVAIAAELAYVEFYRKVVSKYEDKKWLENGEIE